MHEQLLVNLHSSTKDVIDALTYVVEEYGTLQEKLALLELLCKLCVPIQERRANS